MRIRAAVAAGPAQPFAIEQLDLDPPRSEEVLVRLVATGVCQTDAHARAGHTPAPSPIVLGHEGAGIVERVGEAVTGLRPGDHVVLSFQACGECAQCLTGRPSYCDQALAANFSGARLDGSRGLHRADAGAEPVFGHFFGQSSFATHALATERNAVKVDADLPLELLGPLGCGFQTGAGAVLNTFAVPAGAAVAVLGVGAVGFGALMAAKLAGASTVVAIDVNAGRLALAEELGATHTVHATQTDVTAALRDITGAGADYVLDTTGRADMLGHAVASLAPLGQVGLMAGSAAASVAVGGLALGKSLRGIVQGDAVPRLFIPKLARWFREGRFPIDRLVRFYDFDDIDTAFADAARGDVVKPVLRFADAGRQEQE